MRVTQAATRAAGSAHIGLLRVAVVGAWVGAACAHSVPVGFGDEAPSNPRACAPSMMGQPDTLTAVVYATAGYDRRAGPDVRQYRENFLRTVLSFYIPSERVTAPMLTQAPLSVDTSGVGQAPGPVLDGELVVVLERSGRVRTTRVVTAPDAPELMVALRAAVLHADSTRALSPLPPEHASETAELRIRLFGTGSRLPPPIDSTAAVFTIAEPRFVAARVDVPAKSIAGPTGPRYPRDLRSAGMEGMVELQFIVDASGRAEPASVRTLYESHPAFTASVREALPALQYVAARIGECAARSWMRQRFEFRLGD